MYLKEDHSLDNWKVGNVFIGDTFTSNDKGKNMTKRCQCEQKKEIDLSTCTWAEWDDFVYHVAYEEHGDQFHTKTDWEAADMFVWDSLTAREQQILEEENPCTIA